MTNPSIVFLALSPICVVSYCFLLQEPIAMNSDHLLNKFPITFACRFGTKSYQSFEKTLSLSMNDNTRIRTDLTTIVPFKRYILRSAFSTRWVADHAQTSKSLTPCLLGSTWTRVTVLERERITLKLLLKSIV